MVIHWSMLMMSHSKTIQSLLRSTHHITIHTLFQLHYFICSLNQSNHHISTLCKITHAWMTHIHKCTHQWIACVMQAVSRSGWMLELATVELRNDRDVVLAAINNDPLSIRSYTFHGNRIHHHCQSLHLWCLCSHSCDMRIHPFHLSFHIIPGVDISEWMWWMKWIDFIIHFLNWMVWVVMCWHVLIECG